MQFGSSSRVLKVGYVVLLTVFGTLTTRAQYTDFGQALGSSSGQQVTCNPQDLACQAAQQNPADQGNLQRRMPSTNQQPNPQGVVLPGQELQNNTTTGNLTQQQQQLSLDCHWIHLPSFNRWLRIRSAKCCRFTG